MEDEAEDFARDEERSAIRLQDERVIERIHRVVIRLKFPAFVMDPYAKNLGSHFELSDNYDHD